MTTAPVKQPPAPATQDGQARHGRRGRSASTPACEHVFVTSQGHPYAIFRRALERRHVAAAWAAAADLPQLTLADALAFCFLVRDREPRRYGRLAVRWLARFCDEQAGVDMDEAALVAVHLA